jgi:OOP family OmpA-OmpF porin
MKKNTSAFPDLGLARANDVKNYFVSKGIAADKFETKSEMRDSWSMVGDTVLGPIDLFVDNKETATAAPSEDWNALKAKINANPLILYFNTNQSEINLTAEERQKVADISKYLDHVADAKVSAVGHTDNVGDRTKKYAIRTKQS